MAVFPCKSFAKKLKNKFQKFVCSSGFGNSGEKKSEDFLGCWPFRLGDPSPLQETQLFCLEDTAVV